MRKWARLHSNIVVEVVDTDPTGKYHPSIQWVEVPTYLVPFINTSNFMYENNTIIPISLNKLKDDLKLRLLAIRYEKENAGVLVQGVRIATDDRSKNLLHGARTKAEGEIAEAIAEALADGKTEEEGRQIGLAITHTLDIDNIPIEGNNAQFIAMSTFIAKHTQLAFDRWGEIWRLIHNAISAEDIVQAYVDNIDVGWEL